jgi:hypothetical protein
MTQLNKSSSSQAFHNLESETYRYNDTQVKIITVFTDSGKAIALVEDENGEVFEVAKDSLL